MKKYLLSNAINELLHVREGAQQDQIPSNPTKHLLKQFVICSEEQSTSKTYLRYLLCDANVIYIWLIVVERHVKELDKKILGPYVYRQCGKVETKHPITCYTSTSM
jgi:hypothetical protein